jgi:uncharacterized protein YdeI (YjbR/CyaY-like superfamily)
MGDAIMAKTLAEYEMDIPATIALLNETPKTKVFFEELTPGYQREWARYIFGAKALETRTRHIEQMKLILAAGYKSKRAYDQRPK